MKVLITNTVSLNAGDAAILYSIIKIVKKTFGNNTEILVFDSQSKIAQKYHSEISFCPLLYAQLREKFHNKILYKFMALVLLGASVIWRTKSGSLLKKLLPSEIRDSMEHYWEADLVISTGGTYLTSYHHLFPRIFDYIITIAAQKPLVFYTQSIGPITRLRDRIPLGLVFRRAHCIMLRDERSKQNIKKFNISSEKVFVCADAAFALASKYTDSSRQIQNTLQCKVVISVRHWPYFVKIDNETGMKRYIETMASLCDHLIAKYNARIVFVSTCQGIPEYWTDDSEVAESILPLLSNQSRTHVHIDHQYHRPEDLIKIFREFDFAVTTRMHAAILAMCAGTPAIAIAYEFKTQELFNRLGLSDFVLDIEELEKQDAIAKLDMFLRDRVRIGNNLWPSVMRERDSALNSANLLKSVMASATLDRI